MRLEQSKNTIYFIEQSLNYINNKDYKNRFEKFFIYEDSCFGRVFLSRITHIHIKKIHDLETIKKFYLAYDALVGFRVTYFEGNINVLNDFLQWSLDTLTKYQCLFIAHGLNLDLPKSFSATKSIDSELENAITTYIKTIENRYKFNIFRNVISS